MRHLVRDRGIRTFLTIWLGQLASLLGDSLTQFALGIWIYQTTGEVTPLGLVLFFSVVPEILAAPVAGVLVDRWDRRRVILASDLLLGALTAIPVLLLAGDRLALWHIYLVTAAKAVVSAFRSPAYEATVSLLVPREHLGRASGIMRFGLAAGDILAPVTGAVLLVSIGLQGVMLIDLATFAVAALTVFVVRFPAVPPSEEEAGAEEPFRRQVAFGTRYIFARRGFAGLVLLSALIGFGGGAFETLINPLLIERFSVTALGIVTAAGGAGFVAGGLLMGVWGGPSRRIHGVLGGWMLAGAGIAMVAVMPTPALAAAAMFTLTFAHPIAMGSTQAIWQTKTPPALQGRVFSTRSAMQMLVVPAAYLAAGPAADHTGNVGSLSGPLAQVAALVPGAGVAQTLSFLVVVTGGFIVLVAGVCYLIPSIARIEDDLPDAIPSQLSHQALVEAGPPLAQPG